MSGSTSKPIKEVTKEATKPTALKTKHTSRPERRRLENRLQTAHSIVMERRRLEKQTTDRAQHRHGTKTTQGSDLNKYKGTKLANFSNLTPESQNIKLH